MKRYFDIFLSIFLLINFFPLMILISLLILFTSTGPVLFWSNRVGRSSNIFRMPKFRTMVVNTPMVASHLLSDSSKCLTPVGSFLRRSSLDELPQLWSILTGKMSFVGPRPALFNQNDLLELRMMYGVDKMVPGLTGWAQVNGRDELSLCEKVQFEIEYLEKRCFSFDMVIIWLTFLRVVQRTGVSH
jgi:O-antigen biosynthesis protein WbqP